MNTSACGPKEDETPKIQTGNCSFEKNKEVSKVFRPSHMENAISKIGERNSTDT